MLQSLHLTYGGTSADANLAHDFHAKFSTTNNSFDWYVDYVASAYMTPSIANLSFYIPYKGNKQHWQW